MKNYKILVANSDNSQLENYCNRLKNNSRLNITSINNGIDALDAYIKLKPDVFVLDTKFNDITCSEIIDKISVTRKECKNCNIILTTYSNNIYPISNFEKIYKVLYKNFNYTSLENTIREICINNKYLELNETDLKLMLTDLKLNINSNCTKYLIEAIFQCYYYPHLLNNLDNIIKLVSCQFNVSEKIIKYSFRNALRPINNYRNSIKGSSFISLFDESRNITPKYFLDIITTYLHKQNQIKYN